MFEQGSILYFLNSLTTYWWLVCTLFITFIHYAQNIAINSRNDGTWGGEWGYLQGKSEVIIMKSMAMHEWSDQINHTTTTLIYWFENLLISKWMWFASYRILGLHLGITCRMPEIHGKLFTALSTRVTWNRVHFSAFRPCWICTEQVCYSSWDKTARQ